MFTLTQTLESEVRADLIELKTVAGCSVHGFRTLTEFRSALTRSLSVYVTADRPLLP